MWSGFVAKRSCSIPPLACTCSGWRSPAGSPAWGPTRVPDLSRRSPRLVGRATPAPPRSRSRRARPPLPRRLRARDRGGLRGVGRPRPAGDPLGACRIGSELIEARVGDRTAWRLKGALRRPQRRIVRLLPAWNTYLMGYRDRDFIAGPARWRRIMPGRRDPATEHRHRRRRRRHLAAAARRERFEGGGGAVRGPRPGRGRGDRGGGGRHRPLRGKAAVLVEGKGWVEATLGASPFSRRK